MEMLPDEARSHLIGRNLTKKRERSNHHCRSISAHVQGVEIRQGESTGGSLISFLSTSRECERGARAFRSERHRRDPSS
jgi:hypothetical protein